MQGRGSDLLNQHNATARSPHPGTSPPSLAAHQIQAPQRAADGSRVRFGLAGTNSVDVTIDQDSPAVRDVVSMLPLTLTLKEFNGRERIADLPRKLEYGGSPGSKPMDPDLIYCVPWGDVGFDYNAAGIGHSNQTIHLGTCKPSPALLEKPEGLPVSVEVAHRCDATGNGS